MEEEEEDEEGTVGLARTAALYTRIQLRETHAPAISSTFSAFERFGKRSARMRYRACDSASRCVAACCSCAHAKQRLSAPNAGTVDSAHKGMFDVDDEEEEDEDDDEDEEDDEEDEGEDDTWPGKSVSSIDCGRGIDKGSGASPLPPSLGASCIIPSPSTHADDDDADDDDDVDDDVVALSLLPGSGYGSRNSAALSAGIPSIVNISSRDRRP